MSIDQYGNFTTNVGGLGSAPHAFTGAGEQVWVSFEGYTTAKLPISLDVLGATYTTAQVNNVIMNEVNSDPVMNKLLHVTLGSAGSSLIISSLVDGLKTALTAPTINFGNDGSAFTHTSSAADLLALSQYALQFASSDGATTGTGGANSLTGANASGTVNNSSITDTGSAALGWNVIDLSSSSTSANAVNLTTSTVSNDIIINAKQLDVITVNSAVSAAGGTGTTLTINLSNGQTYTNIAFVGDTGVTATAAGAAGTSVATAIANALTAAAVPHEVGYATYLGNTYVADNNGVVIELTGTHTFGALAGHLTVA